VTSGAANAADATERARPATGSEGALPAEVSTVEGLKVLVGREIGVGRWHLVTQEQVDAFADVTGDHQYIHVDPERARETMYGGTIAHGYLTLSLLPLLTRDREGVRVDFPAMGARMTVNYGVNRMRFPAPVRVGRRIRVRTVVLSVEDVAGIAVSQGTDGAADGAGTGAGADAGSGTRAETPAAIQIAWRQTVEVEGSEKPAMVAETLTRVYF
jgi:acyl dehydratase